MVDVPGEAAVDRPDAGLPPARGSIAVSPSHACAVDPNGGVWCWGSNQFGQLGDGTTTARLTATRVQALGPALSVAVGQVSTCAGLLDGTVQCWGLDPLRDVHAEPTVPPDALVLSPRSVANLTNVRSVSVVSNVNGGVICAVRVGGDVWCWGSFFDGVLGDPVGPPLAAPVGPSSLANVSSLTLTAFARCAVFRSGTASCWGQRPWDTAYSPDLAPLDGVTDAIETSIGSGSLCVLSGAGATRCLGSNRFGELGNGGAPMADPHTLVAVSGLTGATALSSNTGLLTVALRSDGSVVQWGQVQGQGNGPAPGPYLSPVPVTGLTNVVGVSANIAAACAIREDGTVLCWGDNNSGQLGDGTRTSHRDPIRVVGLGP